MALRRTKTRPSTVSGTSTRVRSRSVIRISTPETEVILASRVSEFSTTATYHENESPDDTLLPSSCGICRSRSSQTTRLAQLTPEKSFHLAVVSPHERLSSAKIQGPTSRSDRRAKENPATTMYPSRAQDAVTSADPHQTVQDQRH